jgi:hypothetical protein
LAKDESSIGCVGVLIVATRGSAGPGEVQIKIRGGSEAFLAWSEQPLPRGATVLIVDSRGARAVDVIEWDDVLGDSPGVPGLNRPGGTTPPVPPDTKENLRCSATEYRPLMRPC